MLLLCVIFSFCFVFFFSRAKCITQRPWCMECLIDFKFSPVQADSPLFSPSMEQSASSNKLVQVTDL